MLEPDPIRAATNRSIPESSVIPELAYPDVRAAVDWLTRAFGFVERLAIGAHRAQLVFGSGALVVIEGDGGGAGHRVMVRVDNVDVHCERARVAGARILQPPTDHTYGERQYAAIDPAGHHWVFSETIADVDPAAWGGELLDPR